MASLLQSAYDLGKKLVQGKNYKTPDILTPKSRGALQAANRNPALNRNLAGLARQNPQFLATPQINAPILSRTVAGAANLARSVAQTPLVKRTNQFSNQLASNLMGQGLQRDITRAIADPRSKTPLGVLYGLSQTPAAKLINSVSGSDRRLGTVVPQNIREGLPAIGTQMAGTLPYYIGAYKAVAALPKIGGAVKGLEAIAKAGGVKGLAARAIGAYAVGDPLVGAARGAAQSITDRSNVVSGIGRGVVDELTYPIQAATNIPKLGAIVLSDKYAPEDRVKAGLGLGLSALGLLPMIGGLSDTKLLKILPDDMKPYLPAMKELDNNAKLAIGDDMYAKLSKIANNDPKAYVRSLIDSPGALEATVKAAENGKIEAGPLRKLLEVADTFYEKLEGGGVGAQGNRFDPYVKRLNNLAKAERGIPVKPTTGLDALKAKTAEQVARENFNKRWADTYGNRPATVRTLTELDRQNFIKHGRVPDGFTQDQMVRATASNSKPVPEIDRTQLTGKQLSTPSAKLNGSPENIASQKQTPPLESQAKQSQTALKQEPPATLSRIPTRVSKEKAKASTAKLKVSSPTSNIPPATARELESVAKSVNSKVSLIDYMRTPDRVLKKIGLGAEADLIKKQYNSYLDQLPEEISKVTSWYERVGRSQDASKRIFKYLDGEDVKLVGEELAVAKEMKGYLAEWADKLQLPKDKRIANYITHIFEKDFIKKEFDEDLAKIIADKVPGSVYDPFLQQRLGKMGYVEDAFRALDAYVKRATRKYNMDPALEQLKASADSLDLDSMKYVKSYADKINLRPTHIDTLIDTAVKQSPVGYKLGARPVASVSRGLRQAVYRGTLGLNVGSAIRNLTQGANTYAQLGEKYTLIGYMKVMRALVGGSDELTQTGVLRNSFIEDRSISATKKFWEKTDKGLFSFFELAEKINRGAAYYGEKARSLAKGASEIEAQKAGVEMARKTQFTFGSVDTPVALQADIAKLLTQFQSFNVKQTEFLADMVKGKEYAGLIRWLGANAVLLVTVGQVMGWDWNDFVPFGGVLDGQTPIGGSPVFTLAKDLGTVATGGNDRYGQPMKAGQLLEDLVPLIPGGVQIKKTIGGLTDVNRGYSESQTGRVRYPVEQSPTNYVRGGVLGPYKLAEYQKYKDSEAGVLGENQSATFRALPAEARQAYYDNLIKERGVENTVKGIKDGEIKVGEVSDVTDPKVRAALFEAGTSPYEMIGGKLYYRSGEDVKSIDISKLAKLPANATMLQKLSVSEDAKTAAKNIILNSQIFDPSSTISPKVAYTLLKQLGQEPRLAYYSAIDSLDTENKAPVIMDLIKRAPRQARMKLLWELIDNKVFTADVNKELAAQDLISLDAYDALANFIKRRNAAPKKAKAKKLKVAKSVYNSKSVKMPTLKPVKLSTFRLKSLT